MLPTGYTHLGAAKEIAPTLREFGLDPDPIIRAAGLDPRLFDDGANVIPGRALGRLCTLSVARTRCRHFGLLAGRRTTILSLGLVGRLMLHSETLGDALRSLVANLGVQDRVVVPSLELEGDTAMFSSAVYQREMESADQITDGAIACVLNAIRALLGADWAPTEVLLPRGQPADTEPYRRLSGTGQVQSGDGCAGVSEPLPGAPHRRRRSSAAGHAGGADQAAEGGQGPEFSDDIRRLLRMRLTSNRCSADDIADLLAIHRRTLSRRLKGGRGIQGHHKRNPVRNCASTAEGYRGASRPDRGRPRLFGSERLYAGLPALVRRDPDRVAGEPPPRRAAELTRAASQLISTRQRPRKNSRAIRSRSIEQTRPSSAVTSGDRGCAVR